MFLYVLTFFPLMYRRRLYFIFTEKIYRHIVVRMK